MMEQYFIPDEFFAAYGDGHEQIKKELERQGADISKCWEPLPKVDGGVWYFSPDDFPVKPYSDFD